MIHGTELVSVPGADAKALVTCSRFAPGWWNYLLTVESTGEWIASDAIELPTDMGIDHERVARIAFLLEVEYS